MEELWREKGYYGSGSYHGSFHCENPDCPKEDDLKFSPSRMWFVCWGPEEFENRHFEIVGFCSKRCMEEALQ